MGFNASYQAMTQIAGAGLGAGGEPYIMDTQQTTPASTNAPPPQDYTLQAGSNTLVMPPNSFAFSRVQLLPPAGSSNAKTVQTSGAVTACSGWTGGSITLPVVPGGNIYIGSTGVETIIAAYS